MHGGSAPFFFSLPEFVEHWKCMLSLLLDRKEAFGWPGLGGWQWSSSLSHWLGRLSSGGEF